ARYTVPALAKRRIGCALATVYAHRARFSVPVTVNVAVAVPISVTISVAVGISVAVAVSICLGAFIVDTRISISIGTTPKYRETSFYDWAERPHEVLQMHG